MIRPSTPLWLIAAAATGLALSPQDPVQAPIHQNPRAWAYLYLGNHPKARENGWSEALQGVAHDDRHWFFTQKSRLWKFPDSINLRSFINQPDPARGILRVGIPQALAARGYHHFGDLDQHRGLLLVPMDGGQPAVIAFFRTRDLSFVGHIELPRQRNAGWNAVDPRSGRIYSSNNAIGPGKANVLAYELPWGRAVAGQLPRELLPVRELQLLDELGAPIELDHMQGGVFADREFLTVNGFCNGSTTNTGIMVFDTATGRRRTRSTNGSGDFNFEFHPGLHCYSEEPEGIDIWDLDDRRAPGIAGQVHVIMIDNDWQDADDFYFKHYRRLPVAAIQQ